MLRAGAWYLSNYNGFTCKVTARRNLSLYTDRHNFTSYPLALVREPCGCLPEGMALAPKTTEHALSGATLPRRDMPKDNDQMLSIKKQCSRSRRHQQTMFKESDHFISARTSTYQWKFLPCSAATGMPVTPHKIRIILIYCMEGWVGEVD